MTPRRAAPPLWFLLCLAVVEALVYRVVSGNLDSWTLGGGQGQPVTVAFWPAIILIGSLIWKGLEVAGRVSLAVLQWVVANLSLVVTKALNALKDVGLGLLTGLKKTWEFFKLTYDRVLKPAVLKFWRWFDKARKWLDDTFRPVLDFLKGIRDNLLLFYKTWIRPWLDLIDITRRGLRILSSLGVAWARKLDAQLGAIEDKIERPFRYVLAKVNEIVNLVNRVITADGLFQRAALIRSLGRDYKYAWNLIRSAYSNPLTDAQRDEVRKRKPAHTVSALRAEFEEYFETGTGKNAARLNEVGESMMLAAEAH